MAPKAAKKKKLCFKRAGQVYWGDCVEIDGKYTRHGYGLQIWGAQTVSGDPVVIARYEGFWEMGAMTGQGRMEFYDGSCYTGDFVKGSMTGTGRLEWSNGSAYDGMFLRNQMNGQGRFINKKKLWEGHFHRNCVVAHGGTWQNLAVGQANLEKENLKNGDISASPVFRIKRPDDLGAALDSCRNRNLVPLLIRDNTFQEDMTPEKWLNKGYKAVDCEIHIRFVAKLKLRKQDYGAHIFERIQRGILAGVPVPIIFDACAAKGELDLSVPDEWRLDEFYNHFTMPLEIFDLQLFHGRGFVEYFLPKEAQERSVLNTEFPLAPALEADAEAPAPSGEEPPPEGAEGAEAAEAEAAPVADLETPAAEGEQRKIAYKFHPAIILLGRLKSDATDEDVRATLHEFFRNHLPLHRCGFLFFVEGAQQEPTPP